MHYITNNWQVYPFDVDIPTGEAEERGNVAILVTSAGGHVGYLDTFWPFVISKNFMVRLVRQYLDSIMIDNNYDKFISS